MLKVSRFALCYRERPCSHKKLWSTPAPFLLNPCPSASQPALKKLLGESTMNTSPPFMFLLTQHAQNLPKFPPLAHHQPVSQGGNACISVVSVALLFLDLVNTTMSILRNKEYKSCHLRSHTTETPSREEHRILYCHVTAHGSFSGSWS